MSKPRIACSIILTRGEDPAREVYLVKRSAKLKAFAGQWAFPGGTLDEIDKNHSGSQLKTLMRCAVREILEETGILLSDITHPTEATAVIRQELLDQNESDKWNELIETIAVDKLGFNQVCEITTPPISKIRFQTQFMQVQVDDTVKPEIIPGELDEGDFFLPSDAIKKWESGEMHVSPPVLFLLRLMENTNLTDFIASASEAAMGFEQGLLHPAYFHLGYSWRRYAH